MATLTPQQAAFVAQVSTSTVHRAIDRKEVKSERRSGRRQLGIPEVVYLKMRGELRAFLSNAGRKELYASIRSEYNEKRNLSGFRRNLKIGPVQVSLGAAVDSVVERMARLEAARERVVLDEEIRGGEPTVRGTRVPVYLLAELKEQGASDEELLEDYPSLTAESLRAALLYAQTQPRRGRKPDTPSWPKGRAAR